jgi:predicted TIM-barrel fold metal-dependent hydrolase
MPTYPWYHPTGWLRNDAFDRASTAVGAQLVGQTLDRVRANVLEPLALDHGVVTPDEAAAFSILPNGMLAAQLSRAYNDWLLGHWLEPEPRLRGLVVVAAQHPEAAAAEIRRVGERDEFVGVFLPGGARIPYGTPFTGHCGRRATTSACRSSCTRTSRASGSRGR